MKKITIAIDGYSSCGKSTLAKAIALKLAYRYIDTGAMYRAITLFCLKQGIIKNKLFVSDDVVFALRDIHVNFKFNLDTNSSVTLLNGIDVEEEIRTMEISSLVSSIAKIAAVRLHLVTLQREMGEGKAIVMDGRDIGTNVFPLAELKLFMTADPAIRAQRRYDELVAVGTTITLADVNANLISRDYEDTHRQENPLLKAVDAVLLDNSNLNKEEQLDFVMKLVSGLT